MPPFDAMSDARLTHPLTHLCRAKSSYNYNNLQIFTHQECHTPSPVVGACLLRRRQGPNNGTGDFGQ